jgi:tRNA (pseudouridine54-N1)-methyltransferase
MREFLLYSRTGVTSSRFRTLLDAGRLDIVHQCAVMALFKSQAHRNDTIFHVILNGPPSPPLHITVEGNELRDARIDERSWEVILRNVLGGKTHPGISITKEAFQKVVKDKHASGSKIFVLSKSGKPLEEAELGENPFFIVGDHVGLPKKDELFALRYGEAISLGHQKYLAASCIDILNYSMDKRETAALIHE